MASSRLRIQHETVYVMIDTTRNNGIVLTNTSATDNLERKIVLCSLNVKDEDVLHDLLREQWCDGAQDLNERYTMYSRGYVYYQFMSDSDRVHIVRSKRLEHSIAFVECTYITSCDSNDQKAIKKIIKEDSKRLNKLS